MNIKLIVGAVVMTASFLAGWRVNDWRHASLEQDRIEAVRQARERADAAELKAAQTKATVIEKEKVVTNEIIKYVTKPDRTVCEFDAEWVRIYSETLRTADPRRDVTD